MRLDLGLLQMELTGRPDGAEPHGYESLLEYYEASSTTTSAATARSWDFISPATQCQSLREEAAMYYQRYLSLFVLEDFAGVVRDTARNLRVLDFCGKFAVEEQDRLILEQYRPYITMMNARAKASLLFNEKRLSPRRWTIVQKGLDDIREFFDRFGQAEASRKERSESAQAVRPRHPQEAAGRSDPEASDRSSTAPSSASATKKPPSSATRSSARSNRDSASDESSSH